MAELRRDDRRGQRLPYALTAAIVTNDLHLAHRTAAEVRAGYVEVNGKISHALGTPFGGMGMSGFGREGNLEELLSYTQIKSVSVNLDPAPCRALP
jgi:acyl-CoA reductase-like NAD-dependent aldehyde dehydrogenase